MYLALIVLAILLLALSGLVVRSTAAGVRQRPAPDTQAEQRDLESDTLKSMGCNVARFARAGEEKGEGTCPTRSCWAWCRPWRA